MVSGRYLYGIPKQVDDQIKEVRGQITKRLNHPLCTIDSLTSDLFYLFSHLLSK